MSKRVQCKGRTISGYDSKTEADWAADHMSEPFVSYWCEDCGLFHITPKSNADIKRVNSTCVDSTGKTKNAYATYEDACAMSKQILKSQGVKTTVYKCDDCKYFHLTSRK